MGREVENEETEEGEKRNEVNVGLRHGGFGLELFQLLLFFLLLLAFLSKR